MPWKKQGVFHVIQKSEVAPIWTNFERHWKNSDIREYIRCEMTPTSAGGEQQISISGGSQSPI